MFCKFKFFVKIVHLAFRKDTQFRAFLFLEGKFGSGTHYILSIHDIIILLYKFLMKPCMSSGQNLRVIFMK